MKPLKSLTPADFPGYDTALVADWLEEARRANQVIWAFYAVLVGFVALVLVMEPRLLAVAILFAILVPFLVYRRSWKARREAKVTRHVETLARRGELPPPQPVQPAVAATPAPAEEVHV